MRISELCRSRTVSTLAYYTAELDSKPDDEKFVIVCLLADLRHYCLTNEISMEDCIETSKKIHQVESEFS